MAHVLTPTKGIPSDTVQWTDRRAAAAQIAERFSPELAAAIEAYQASPDPGNIKALAQALAASSRNRSTR